MKNVLRIGLVALVLSGCGSKEETPAEVPAPPSESAVQKAPDLSQAGSVSGRVRFEGTPPATREVSVKGNPECSVHHAGGMIPQEEFLVKDGNLQNVFVYVKAGLEGYSFPVPTEPVTVDNNKCVYVPRVIGAQTGQPIHLLNSDETLHNVHAFAQENKSFNLGLPFKGLKQVKRFDRLEVMVKLKCDVHPWMTGYIGVLPHPYFQVTGEDGAFELKNLPPGTYEIVAWHEKLGTKSQSVTIGPTEAKTADFLFTA